MDESQVRSALKRHMGELRPELNIADMKPTDSLKEMGFDSVERAEIVTLLMEELAVDVPRTKLAKAQNIGELIQLFLDHQ